MSAVFDASQSLDDWHALLMEDLVLKATRNIICIWTSLPFEKKNPYLKEL